MTTAFVETRVAPSPGADGLPQSLAPLQALVSTNAEFRGYTNIRAFVPDADIERFWQNVEKTAHCWLWTGAITNGYGRFRVNPKTFAAHRVAWELLNGVIPDGMTIDHLCRNRGCVNPAHLEVVTNRENVLRGEGITARLARMTHCRNGHEWTPENTYVWKETRRCRACQTARLAKRCRRKGLVLEKPADTAGLSSATVPCATGPVRVSEHADRAAINGGSTPGRSGSVALDSLRSLV